MSKRTRRRLLVFGMLAVTGLGGWLLWASVEGDPVRPGMTFDEVRAILGDPESINLDPNFHTMCAVWNREHGRTTIRFDRDFVVPHEPLFDRVRRWLRL